MFTWTYYRRGTFHIVVAATSSEALSILRDDKGSTWADWQLTSKAELTFATLPAQKLA